MLDTKSLEIWRGTQAKRTAREGTLNGRCDLPEGVCMRIAGGAKG